MKKILFLFLIMLFGCGKEEIEPIFEPNAILNTQNWKVTDYSNDGVISNVFKTHVFSFSINETPGCPDWIDGECIGGVFGGHYFIFMEQGTNKFKIILPDSCNLNEINGVWQIRVINGKMINLYRINENGNQKITLQR